MTHGLKWEMTSQALQLFPPPAPEHREVSLDGLYLRQNLHRLGAAGNPFVYANFVASIDGRIALTDDKNNAVVPRTLTTDNDWLLFRELQAQADCLVTHGGYLRALARGEFDDILQIGADADDPLRQWRAEQGFRVQPAIIVISNSLNFPVPPSIKTHGQPFYIVTTSAADRTRVKLWRTKGYEVLFCGGGSEVTGADLRTVAAEHGYRSVYLQAGPQIMNSMLAGGHLARLYLTMSHQLLGGNGTFTLGSGAPLGAAGALALRSLYMEARSEQGCGQFFTCFEPPAVEAQQ